MKQWADGDKIYASDLNELVSSGNLVFANAAARDAFLVNELAPTPGVTVNMQDDQITYRRIAVAGTNYWAPVSGTHLVCVTMQTAVNMTNNTATQITNMTTIKTRNTGNMWANNRFTPTIPGWYEFDAHVIYSNNLAGDGYRAAWLSLNGASTATAIPGSWNQIYPVNAPGSALTVATRNISYYFTGIDGAYVTLMGMHNSTTASFPLSVYAGTSTNPAYATSFSAKYLGT